MVMRYIENYLGIQIFNINNLVPNTLETFKVTNFDNCVLEHMKELFKFKNVSMKSDYDVYKYMIRIYCSLFGNDIVKNIGRKKVHGRKCYRYKINTDCLLANYHLMVHRITDERIIDEGVRKLLGIELDVCMF